MTSQQFPFEFEPRYRRAGRVFGVTPGSTSITVTDTGLQARFGPWRATVALDNIDKVQVSGPFAFLKTAGPAHLGLTDRGLTFATNSHAGVYLEFHEPITGIDPFGLIKHPNLTLTPADTAGLAALLSRAT